MKKTYKNQQGFTIVELLIAITVFSMVLLLCSMAIIHVGKMYYKGNIINRTQDTSRKVLEDITQTVQFGRRTVTSAEFRRTGVNGALESLCLGNVRYSFTRGMSMGTGAGQARNLLWKDIIPDTVADCPPLDVIAGGLPDGQEMLGTNMRLPLGLNVTESAGVWTISFRVSYGDLEDLFVSGTNFGECRSADAGGEFCAVSDMNTGVVKRL